MMGLLLIIIFFGSNLEVMMGRLSALLPQGCPYQSAQTVAPLALSKMISLITVNKDLSVRSAIGKKVIEPHHWCQLKVKFLLPLMGLPRFFVHLKLITLRLRH